METWYYSTTQSTRIEFVSRMKITSFHLYVLKRLGYIVLTLFLISAIVFAATAVLPGNAATMILGRQATQEKIAALEQQLGLNKPLYVQYADWLTGMVTGDAGESLALRQPVVEVVQPRFMRSLQLAVLTLLTTVAVGIPLGVLSAVKRNSIVDRLSSAAAYFGVSLPEFVTGTLLILLLGGPIFGIFPSSGYIPPNESLVGWAMHMILPVATLTILLIAHIMRQTRSELIEVLQSEYVRSARLKGLTERTVLVKHALRNGLLPTITVLALDFGWLMGSLVVVEEIFAYPGIGRLVVFAIQNRDIPLLQFIVIIIAVSYTFANFGADLLYGYLDPRIDYGEGE